MFFPAGAAGLSVTASAAVASIGGSVGAGVGWLASLLQDEEGQKRKEEEKMIFWVTVLPALIIMYGCDLSLTSVAAAACAGAGAGWLARLFQNKRQQRKEEEEMRIYACGIAALALVSFVYLNRSSVRRNRKRKPQNTKISESLHCISC